MARGEIERAEAALALCTEIGEDLGQPALRWRVTHLHIQRAMAAGRFSDVERWGAEALRLGEASGQPDSFFYSNGPLALAMVLQGRAEDAEALLVPIIERVPRPIYRGIHAWALAEAGRIEEARAIVESIREPKPFTGVPRDHHLPVTLCAVSRACHLLDDAAVAQELYDLLLPFRSTIVNGQTIWLGPATHELGLLATVLGRYDEAESHFADAVERQDRIGARGHVVHTRIAWAVMLRRRNAPGNGARAQRLLDEARTGAREVGLPRIEASIDALPE
jgi:tetratricopeptide (TPR) repeat protein